MITRPRSRGLVSALLLFVIAGACSRTPPLESFTSEKAAFTIAYPQGWAIVRGPADDRVWFVPTSGARPGDISDPTATLPHLSSAEFLLVFTQRSPGPFSDDEVRREGLRLLPIHGVSGFRRFKEEAGRVWHRFEVTGASTQDEWASVGLFVAGAKGFHYVVCAKPLPRWRDGQRQCDEILKTFRPGDL